MKSYCYVILPSGTDVTGNLYDIVKQQIIKYYQEREVEPYKHFYTKKYTHSQANRFGFDNSDDFNNYLQQNEEGYGIENGLLYMITTYNPDSKWDYFFVEEVKKGSELQNDPPYSIVTPGKEWFSLWDYENKYDKDTAGKQWRLFLNDVFKEYVDNDFVVILVHS